MSRIREWCQLDWRLKRGWCRYTSSLDFKAEGLLAAAGGREEEKGKKSRLRSVLRGRIPRSSHGQRGCCGRRNDRAWSDGCPPPPPADVVLIYAGGLCCRLRSTEVVAVTHALTLWMPALYSLVFCVCCYFISAAFGRYVILAFHFRFVHSRWPVLYFVMTFTLHMPSYVGLTTNNVDCGR